MEAKMKNFNPRTPCGVRHVDALPLLDGLKFQSTHPLRGATSMRSDRMCPRHYFNPRTPCGVRRNSQLAIFWPFYFNPRTPCGVRPADTAGQVGYVDFNPRTPCGVRLAYTSGR